MPTIRLDAQVDGDELLRAVKQLSPADFRRFATAFLTLRAKREAPMVTESESQLLARISQPLPEGLKARYDTMIARPHAETLCPEEHTELLQLGDEVETWEADRLAALADLARLRGMPHSTLLADLGIPATSHG